MSELYTEAAYYKECGLSVLPIADRKRPDGRVLPIAPDEVTGEMGPTWKPFQFHAPDDAYLRQWFLCPLAEKWQRGVGIINGKVSGNLITLDFEDANTFDQWLTIVDDNGLGEYIEDAPIGSTPGGGRHITLRSTVPVPGNTKLALWADKKVRIETRGEGGYVAAPPSRGVVHPTGGEYKRMTGSYATIPVLEPNILNGLIGFCTFFNEYTEPERIYQPALTRRVPDTQMRPGDDFNERGDIRPTLEAHGWHYAKGRGNVEMWTRPGKDGHDTSATLGYGDRCLFYVFSSNAAPFDNEHCYTIFAVKAILDHGDNFAECAKDLGSQGFGTSKEEFAQAILSRQREKRGEAVVSSDTVKEPEQDHPALLIGRHELTDTGNANRYVRMWRQEMRFDHSLKTWYVWNGVFWEEDRTGLAIERAKITARHILIEASEEPDDKVRESIIKHAKASMNAARLEAMISLSKSDPSFAVTHEIWDSNAWLLNVKNGTIELKTGAFREHSRDDLITHISNVDYNPVATCPVWLKCLEQWQPSAEVRAFLQRSVGYSLTGSCQEQKFFYLYGSGANGKSVFLETCRFITGKYWVKAKADSFMKQAQKNASGAQPDIVAMIGKRFVTTSEVSQSERLNEAIVKDITGGDTFPVRDLYRGMVNFTPECKLWFFGNHKPKVDATDSGIWRRVLLVNFGVIIPPSERDQRLINKLQDEASGILNWALEGCREWRKSGLNIPEEITISTSKYRDEEDIIGRFMDEACIFKASNSIASSALYATYATWCKASGEYAISLKKFVQDLKNRGIESQRKSTAVIYEGFTVKSNNEIHEAM